jgi:hypothetical protein
MLVGLAVVPEVNRGAADLFQARPDDAGRQRPRRPNVAA